MQTRNVLNLFLLLLTIALVVTVWFVYQDKSKINHLSSLDATQVTRIVIPREHGEIVLSRQNSTWQMEKPYALPAHDFRVQSMLNLLQTPIEQSYASNELDISQFGLEPPRASIRFNDREIRFGKSNPVNQKRYILSENRVCLINDTLYPLISAEAASLISLTLLDPATQITKIILPELTLQKDPDNIWRNAQGKVIAADSAQQLIDNWRNASAFAAHAYMDRADAKPVTLELNNNMTLKFLAKQENNWLIIGRPDAGVEYHLDAHFSDTLLTLPTPDTVKS